MSTQKLSPSNLQFDHIAIRVANRPKVASELREILSVEELTSDAKSTTLGPRDQSTGGKLVLYDAHSPREPYSSQIVSLVFCEPDEEAIPPPRVLSNGLVLTFQQGSCSESARHALIGAAIRSEDPQTAADDLANNFGLKIKSQSSEVSVLQIGARRNTAILTLVREPRPDDAPPALLKYIGVRVTDSSINKTTTVSGPDHITFRYLPN